MIFKIHKKKWAFLFACSAMLALALGDNIRGPLFSDLLSFFSVNNSQGSFTFALATFAGLLGNLASVPLLRKITMSQLLVGSLVLLGIGLLIMGTGAVFSIYLLGSFVFGFGMGTVGISQNLLITENVEIGQQPKALSFMHSIYGLGSLLAPLMAAWATGFFQNWQSAFILTAVLTGVIFVGALITRAQPLFHVAHYEHDPHSPKSPKKSLFMFGGIFAFYVVAEILVSSRLALYLRTYRQMSLTESSQYVTYFFVFLLMGRLFFSVKKLSIPLKNQLSIFLLVSIVFIILGLLVHPFFFALTGLSMSGYYPLSMGYISSEAKERRRQFLTFAITFQSFCVISMHILVGYLTDQFGLFYAFGVGVVSLLLALVCVLFHPKPY